MDADSSVLPKGHDPRAAVEMGAGVFEPSSHASSTMLAGGSSALPSLAEGGALGDSQFNTTQPTGNGEAREHAPGGGQEPPGRQPARRATLASSFLAFIGALSPTFLLLLLLTFSVMLLLLYMQLWKSKEYLRHKK